MFRTLLLSGLDGPPARHWPHWRDRMEPTARFAERKRWGAECVAMGAAGHIDLASGLGPRPRAPAARAARSHPVAARSRHRQPARSPEPQGGHRMTHVLTRIRKAVPMAVFVLSYSALVLVVVLS